MTTNDLHPPEAGIVVSSIGRVLLELGREVPSTITVDLRLTDDLGLDSFDVMELLLRVEDDLGGTFDTARLVDVSTVGDLVGAFRPGGS